ncbi:MAG: DEAD/DEAH box helicase [Rhizobiales bacterium]|nr:DEAD/DEAH box helicase [Hyphomicrobiales bacterium]
MTSFSDFVLLAPLNKALAGEGYTQPTPIQMQAIPPALEGRDLLGIAQTGTGKTAAFALPILHRLGKTGMTRKPKSCRALILSPTRELASQIAESFKAYGRYMHLSIDVVFGGVPIGKQIRRLATGADILVATPGRLLDLIDQRAITLRDLEILVLDEADQMLDLGFIKPLKRIIPMLPKQRQSLFFSATMPGSIAELADQFLTKPVQVAVTPVATTAERVVQGVMHVEGGNKPALLRAVLTDPTVARVLVFTRTKHGADRVVKGLGRDGIPALAIHGNRSQSQRQQALAAFRSGNCRVLVATDIAARGIDIDGVTHVINYDLPDVPESYVHRIGRTARAGASGIAIAFCSGEERSNLRAIEKLTRIAIPVLTLPEGYRAEPRPARVPQEPGQERREREFSRPREGVQGERDEHRPRKPFGQRPGGTDHARPFAPRGKGFGRPGQRNERPHGEQAAPRQDRPQGEQRQDRPQGERRRFAGGGKRFANRSA